LVRGSVAIARASKISPLIIGLTIVAIGTSAPELVTTLEASLSGAKDMAVGNIIGSNIVNMLLILGAAAVIRPITVSHQIITRDTLMVIAATGLFFAVGRYGIFNQIVGTLFLLILASYLTMAYRTEKAHSKQKSYTKVISDEVQRVPEKRWLAVLYVLVGIIGIIIGAKLTISGGIGIAEVFQVSQTMIGLTLIAIGTSLPELAIVVIASLRGHSHIALGNILGSNLFNILGIIGTVSIVTSLKTPTELINFDLWVLLGITLLLLPLMITEKKISRFEGGFLIFLYITYLTLQFTSFKNIFI
jgi:cation:H+ antiporter|tara:strand:- start:16946 stop:17854 length:909 start_codon:yes stop_codon:yes gene_type:complete